MAGKMNKFRMLSFAMFSLAILVCLLAPYAGYAAQLWPSVKTFNIIPGTQDNIDWLASHYDWIDSPPAPIDNWYSRNPNVISDKYAHWGILEIGAGTVWEGLTNTTRWYDWCAKNNYDWENGFFHVGKQDTYVTQTISDGYGDRWDARIAFVFLNTSTSNQTSAAWAGTAGINLTNLNNAVYFGRLERFNEINLQFSTKASSDWQGVWEYWNGSAWTAMAPYSDTTNDCQLDGKITFSRPPTASQWKRTKVNSQPTKWGDNGIYFLRLRVAAAGTTKPIIKLAQGRHYWVHNGTSGNTLPAWDSANDADGDGFAEAAVNVNATAKYKYEARIPHFWAWYEYALNVGNSTIRQKYADFTVETMNVGASALHKYGSARLDDMTGTPNLSSAITGVGRVLEYPTLTTTSQVTTQWLSDLSLMMSTGKTTLNAAGYGLGANVCYKGQDILNQHFDYHMREDWNRPFTNNWEGGAFAADAQWTKWSDAGKPMLWQWQLQQYWRMGDENKGINLTSGSANITGVGTRWTQTLDAGSIITFSTGGVDKFAEVASVQSDTSATLKAVYTGATVSGQSHTALTVREKYLALAAFLALQKPATDYFSMWWGYYYQGNRSPYFNWIPAVTVNYGNPTGSIPTGKVARGTRATYVLQSGIDPSYTSAIYYIYARDYTKAIALFRPIPHASSSYGTNSAVTVTLPVTSDNPTGRYYLVRFDGTVETTARTSVTLRNDEGAILMKVGGGSSPSPSISESVNIASPKPGDIVTYTIIARNDGTASMSNVPITNTIDSRMTYQANSAKLNGATITPDPVSGSTLSVTLAALAPGQSVTITFQAKVN